MESTRSKFEKSDRMPSIKELKSLVVFDVRMENLQTLLSSIVSTLNQHSEYLKTLSEDTKNSLTHSEFSSALSRLSRSIPRATSSEVVSISLGECLSSTIDSLASSLSEMSISLEQSKGREEALKMSVLQLEKSLSSKCEVAKLRSTKQKLKKMIDSKLNGGSFTDKMTVLQNRIDHIDDQTSMQLKTMENTLKETELQSALKVREIEQLLHTKATEQFVWETLDKTTKNISQQITAANLHRFNIYDSKLDELGEKVSSIDLDLAKTDAILRKDMAEIEKNMKEEIVQSIETYQEDVQPELEDIKDKIDVVSKLNCELEIKFNESATKTEFEKLQSELSNKANKSELQALIRSHVASKPVNNQQTPEAKDFQKFKDQVHIRFRDLHKDIDKKLDELDIPSLRNNLSVKTPDFQPAIRALETKLISESDKNKAMAKDIHKLVLEIKHLKKAQRNKNNDALVTSRAAASNNCLSCGRSEKKVDHLNHHFFKNYDKLDSKGDTLRIFHFDRNNSNSDQSTHRTVIKFRPQSAVQSIK